MRRTGGAQSDDSGSGFTIIEVTFFLAISSALAIALFATVGLTISRQRFTDSVLTTQAYLQSGYSETLNVESSRSARTCSKAAGGATVLSDGTTPRGASVTCVVLGRALAFTDGSSRVTSYPVVGYEPKAPGTATGRDLLAAYAPVVDTSDSQTFDIPWDAKPVNLVRRTNPDAHVTKLYLLRSPDSNLVMAFGGNTIQSALAGGTGAFTVCLQSADLTNTVSAVSLTSLAGSEGVTTDSDLSASEQERQC